MFHWILSMIFALAPNSPYRDTFEATAHAIDEVSHETPIYLGEDGPERTAATLVAVAFFESSFDPGAIKDDKGGDSVGLEQINVSNLKWLGMKKEDLLDPKKNLQAAVRLMKASLRMCAGRPSLERLGHYAAGGPNCSVQAGLVASRNRLALAKTLLEQHPTYWADSTN